ncbi:MAG: cyclopropane-fatty-acyl-phospholipid synthase family protein [Leptospirales bacterium]|nr:cyclopropane-fatty-acyl-phospholipid synthase family protein [Leptospirales bacterium]
MIETIIALLDQIKFPHGYVVEWPDGSIYRYATGQPVFKLKIKTLRAMRDILRDPSVGFGEAYMAEEIEVEGDLEQVMHLGFLARSSGLKPGLMQMAKFAWGYFSRRNTMEGSRKNIAAHYDLGNDFYSLWLDREAKQYTCAYFESPRDSIEKAQIAKLDLVCRKLRLQPGETVVEAGCGWGGFALHAVRKYGVKVRAFNISREQIAYARERADRLGIAQDRLEYVHDDYRVIGRERRQYDKFASIGMFEHVGKENYSGLYDIIAHAVKPRGLAMVHTIGRISPAPLDAWLEKYIFPGAYIPSLAEMVAPAEKKNRPLHVVDVENLRYHYALTLDHWSSRLEEHADAIRAQYGEAFLRMFRMYLRASAAGFRFGGILLFQMLLSNGYDDEAPMTRQHMLSASAQKAPPRIAGQSNNGGSATRRKAATRRATLRR